jgi:hypothetical protein
MVEEGRRRSRGRRKKKRQDIPEVDVDVVRQSLECSALQLSCYSSTEYSE